MGPQPLVPDPSYNASLYNDPSYSSVRSTSPTPKLPGSPGPGAAAGGTRVVFQSPTALDVLEQRLRSRLSNPGGQPKEGAFSSTGYLPSLTGGRSPVMEEVSPPRLRSESSLGQTGAAPRAKTSIGMRGSISYKPSPSPNRGNRPEDGEDGDNEYEDEDSRLPVLSPSGGTFPLRSRMMGRTVLQSTVATVVAKTEDDDAAAAQKEEEQRAVGGKAKSDHGLMVTKREDSMFRKAVQIGLCKDDMALKPPDAAKPHKLAGDRKGGSPSPGPGDHTHRAGHHTHRAPPAAGQNGGRAAVEAPLGPGSDLLRRLDSDPGTLLNAYDQHDELAPDSPLPMAPIPQLRAAPTYNANQLHSMGVSFKLLSRFANAVDSRFSTAEVVLNHVLPATLSRKCRYLDILPEKYLAPPGFYVLHAWNANFRQLVSSCELYISDNRLSVEDTFIWIDIFAANQHNPRTNEDLKATKEIIDSVEKVLFFLDSEGMCLSRTWVQFELWHVLSSRRGSERLSILHNPRWDWDQLTHVYASVSVNDSSAHHPEDRAMLIADMCKSVDLSLATGLMRRQLQDAALRDLKRTEKLASVNPKPYLDAALTRAVFLVMDRHIKDAEDTLKRLLSLCDRSRTRNEPRDAQDKDIVGVIIALARAQRLLGKYSDAEGVLQGLVISFRGMEDEVYYDGMAMLAAVLLHRRQFTKAEMMCRKIMQDRDREFGLHSAQSVPTLLQMADIAIAQRLHEEADECLREALLACAKLERDHPDVGRVKHKLALVALGMNREEAGIVAMDDALQARTRLLGWDHPETLETRLLQADFMLKQVGVQPEGKRYAWYEEWLSKYQLILKARVKTFGFEHPTCLEVMGRISDVLYDMGRPKEGLDTEKRILWAGRSLLKHTHVEKFNSLIWISKFLAKREHLLASAALFMARAYYVYKEKLGVDHEVTAQTRVQLTELANNIKTEAKNVLSEADNHRGGDNMHIYAQSELLFRQALQFSRLINPAETEHKDVARGLADSLFGQGKMQEGKKVMATCGLNDKMGKGTMPSSYLRWFNKRVTKYLQKLGDADEGVEGQDSSPAEFGGIDYSSEEENFMGYRQRR